MKPDTLHRLLLAAFCLSLLFLVPYLLSLL